MLCIDPFKNLFITTNNRGKLSIGPCCNAKTWEIDHYDFDNDPKLKEIRTAMLEGKKHPFCNSCWKQEDQGLRSRRSMVNEWAENTGHNNNKVELIKVDYWIGNTCNLACVICNSYASSRWHADAIAMGDNTSMFTVTHTEYWKTLPDTVIDIHFTGGEPLLSKDHNDFLESVKNKNQVELVYNTNGTIKPSTRLLDLWKQFKKIKLVISLDDIGDRFEYQRYPLNWEKFVDNFNFLKSLENNIILNTFSTISILNVFSYPLTYKWIMENFPADSRIDVHFAYGITNCETMPLHFKPILEELYENMPQRFRLDKAIIFEKDSLDPALFGYLKNLDRIRGLDYKKVFPYLT